MFLSEMRRDSGNPRRHERYLHFWRASVRFVSSVLSDDFRLEFGMKSHKLAFLR